jgi:FG-GAP repeat
VLDGRTGFAPEIALDDTNGDGLPDLIFGKPPE